MYDYLNDFICLIHKRQPQEMLLHAEPAVLQVWMQPHEGKSLGSLG